MKWDGKPRFPIPFHTSIQQRQQMVHLFVFGTLADWETGYAVAGINNPDLQKQPGRYQIETVGLTAKPGTTIGGIRILPDIRTTDLPRLTNRRLRYGQ